MSMSYDIRRGKWEHRKQEGYEAVVYDSLRAGWGFLWRGAEELKWGYMKQLIEVQCPDLRREIWKGEVFSKGWKILWCGKKRDYTAHLMEYIWFHAHFLLHSGSLIGDNLEPAVRYRGLVGEGLSGQGNSGKTEDFARQVRNHHQVAVGEKWQWPGHLLAMMELLKEMGDKMERRQGG